MFYNRVQVFNRDLTILCMDLFGEMLEAERTQQFQKAVARREEMERREAEQGRAPQARAPVRLMFDGLRVLEALSATGLRSVRFTKEVPVSALPRAAPRARAARAVASPRRHARAQRLKEVVANDMDPAAVDTIRRNAAYNDVPGGKLIPSCADAIALMYQARDERSQYDVVDIDPYIS